MKMQNRSLNGLLKLPVYPKKLQLKLRCPRSTKSSKPREPVVLEQ